MSRFELIRELTPRRMVVKVGSSLLSDPVESDGFCKSVFSMLAREIAALRKKGIDTLLVSSGAVNTGRQTLSRFGQREPEPRSGIVHRQALSAIGQSPLLARYAEEFDLFRIPVAQILLTARDFRERRSYLNIGHTLTKLMELGVLPIINENDTVATDELQFGENDFLSAAAAALFEADLLVILTSVEGFLLNGRRLSEIKEITPEIRKAAEGPEGPGSGGMLTKLRAGELCQLSGQALAILPGDHAAPISALLDGEDIGTLIHLRGTQVRTSARKKWLLFARTHGHITIDAGASRALQERGASLLPSGIVETRGDFYAREVIEIRTQDGKVIGRGLTNYSARELGPMIGLSSKGIEERGLARHATEVIHRNNLVLEKIQYLES